MRFLKLAINNFGVFRGEHAFDLRNTNSDKHRRNLTLFSGHNGAGKSTLSLAIKLALHGRFVLGDRISHQEYNDFLLSRLHKYKDGSKQIVSDSGEVNLFLEYIQSGSKLIIHVHRNWLRSGTTVSEKLSIDVNGQPPDVREEDYQFWLNELFPPGLSPICFYDAEQLNTFSSPSNQSEGLANLINRLSGLDLVERLQKDLDYYLYRQRGGKKIERLRQKVLQFQATLDDQESDLKKLHEEYQYSLDKQKDLEKILTQVEHNLVTEGGSYAARRPVLKDRLAKLELEIESTSDQLRDLSAQLLPFALVPGLCQKLSKQLECENDLYRRKVANELWQRNIKNLEDSLVEDDVWQGIRASKKNRQALVSRALSKMESNGIDIEGEKALVHCLAEPEFEKLQDLITQSLHSVPPQVELLGKHLKELREEQQQIKIELHRAPEDETLAPLYEEIEKLEAGLKSYKEEQKDLQSQIGIAKYQREEIFRQFQRAGDELRSAQANQRQFELAERSGLVLRTYQDALVRQRVKSLEISVVDCFNTICRKEYLLTSVEIDPESFEITLNGNNNQNMDLNDFSTGENQLFAMALLRALRQINKQQLPLIIDTPLARLDVTHRDRLISDYFPTISDQVILFVTDVEMDEGLTDQAKSSLSHTYHLTFDPKEQASTANLIGEKVLN